MKDDIALRPEGRACVPTELVARLEVAEAGNAVLDRDIFKMFDERAPVEGIENDRWAFENEPGWYCSIPDFTTSLDAALALAERVLPGWTWLARGPDKSSRKPDLCFARLASPDFDAVCWTAGDKTTTDVVAGRDASSHAASPALALCIAVLKATSASSVGTKAEGRSEPETPPDTGTGTEGGR